MNSIKKINVLACTVFVTSLLLAGCDRFRSADTIVARGQEQFQKGNFRAALGDFRTALERNSEHLRARAELARTQLLLGDFEGAFTAIDAAVRRGANDADTLGLKYEILLSLSRFEAVVENVPNESALSEFQRSLFLARAYAGLRQSPAAEAALASALALDARDAKARIVQAILSAEKGDLSSAARVLDAVLVDYPQHAEAWFVRGRVAIAQGDVATAKTALESAESFGNRTLNWRDQAQLFALLTDVALIDRNVEDATRWVTAMNSRVPQSTLGWYLQARIALLKNNVDDAVAHLQRAIAAGDYLPAHLLLAGIQVSKRNYAQAESQLDALLARNPTNAEVRKLLAQVYLATDRLADANRILPSEGAVADPQLDWLRGQTLFASGARDAGIEMLEKGLAADRQDHAKSLQLARAYLMTGQTEKAIKLLEVMPPGVGGAQRQGLLVLASISGKTHAEGQKEIAELLARNPKDSMLHAVAGMVLARTGDQAGAAELLSKAVALDAGNLDARLALAATKFAVRKYDQAEEQLRAVIAVDAKRPQAYIGLAKVALARGDKVQAAKQLELAIGADPAGVEARLQLARLALAEGDLQRAGALLDQAVLVSNNEPNVVFAAGAMLFQAQQYADALVRFDRAAAGGDSRAAFAAVQVQQALGRKEDARARLTSLATDRKTMAQAVAALASMDVEDGKVDAALARVVRLREHSETRDYADELEGDIYAAAKLWDKAIASFDRAYQLAPTQRLAVKRFQSRVAANQPNAVAPLVAWVQRTPRDFAARKVLAKYYVGSGQFDAAIREYEAWLKESGLRDPEMLNDLAWLYGEKGDGRGLDLALEAHTAAPTSPEIADTYGWLLLRRGNVKDALQILESAAKVAQSNPEIQYHYAAALVRGGKPDEARSLLKAILSKHSRFASRSEAERLLSSIDK